MTITIPKAYDNDLHVTDKVIKEIIGKRRGLSDLAVMNTLCDIGNRTLITVGISGTGKSTVAFWMKGKSNRNVIMPHGVTVNGLKTYAEQLDSNSTTILVEDLSRSGSDYMQIATVSVLAGIVYTGSISKHNATLNLDIGNMRGSALIFAQPLIMKKLVKVPEFESDIKDKTLRYYHLYIPLEPTPEPMGNGTKWSSIDRVKVEYDERAVIKYYSSIIDNFRKEVSKARAIEHAQALMKASAVMNDRTKVTEADAWLVLQLSNNFRIEEEIYEKYELEGERKLDANLLPLLTLFASFDKVTIKIVSEVYQVKQARAYEIMKTLGEWAQLQSSTIYPTDKAKKLLKEIGA